MKTEKRLTMALSVLVALMMLAVPLASSSNLFVDGGQTNSNGDAPSLGAVGEGYTITFKLNSDGKSLDAVDLSKIANVNLTVKAPTAENPDATTTVSVSFYKNNDGDLCAFFIGEGVTVQQIINALYTDKDTPLITKGAYTVTDKSDSTSTKYAYDLTSWKDANSGVMYLYKNISAANSDKSPVIDKDMTFDAQWLLNKECVEIPVKVTFDSETKDYVKAYPYTENDGGKIVEVTSSFFDGADVTKIMGVSIKGQSVNPSANDAKSSSSYAKDDVYTRTIKDSKDTELSTDAKEIAVEDNEIIINYTLKSTYSKVTVSSVMFDEDVVMYTKNNTPFTYLNVYYALQNVKDSADKKIFTPGTISGDDGSVLVNSGSYKATSWNDNVPLDSAVNATSQLTLNATLNSYKVVFMVNGEYEIVTVNYGELSADKCPLDVTGLSGWYMPDTAYAKFSDFYFTESNIADLEAEVAKGNYVPVFIAAFTAEPIFAVFNAVMTNDGNFGDKAVTNVVIPVKADSTIPEPVASPVYKEKTLFLGWTGYDASKKASDYSNTDGVITLSANVTTYKYTITFYDGDKSVGVFYMTAGKDLSAEDKLQKDITAIQYDGKLYGAEDGDGLTNDVDNPDTYTAIDAYNDLINYAKSGYTLKQWNDSDGKAMITFTKNASKETIVDKVNIKEIKSDISLYGQFDAKSYTIKYINSLGGEQTQKAYVGENVTLYGANTFINDNYTLIGWTTVPGESGTSYSLGGSYTLSGEDYEKLAESAGTDGVVVELYSEWQSNGSNVPGGNTDGSNDNTALYLIAGMLAVIAILAIVGIVLMRRK